MRDVTTEERRSVAAERNVDGEIDLTQERERERENSCETILAE